MTRVGGASLTRIRPLRPRNWRRLRSNRTLRVVRRIIARRLVLDESLKKSPRAYERAQRLAKFFYAPSIEVASPSEVRRLQEAERSQATQKRGSREDGDSASASASETAAPTVILTAMRWGEAGSLFPGYGWAETRNGAYERDSNGVVCQTAVEIQTIFGCAFDCAYCPYTSVINIACDLENFVQRLGDSFRERPTQQLYKLNNRSDTLCFEPEYGLSALLVNAFARTRDQQLMLYSKSDNVSHLLDLEHGGRTVACFTLTSPGAARLLEKAAPSFEERLAAAAQCANAGYPVRFRFSPIVPLRGWESELRAMVRTMARTVEPELVTLWTLSMTAVDELPELLDPALLDPRFLQAAMDQREAMRGAKGAPFPDAYRAEMYRVVAEAIAEYSPKTRVSLCLETPQVVNSLRDRLAMLGNAQVCNCGPRCTSEEVAASPAAADGARRLTVVNTTGRRERIPESAAGRRRLHERPS